jgi:hypothetical protein
MGSNKYRTFLITTAAVLMLITLAASCAPAPATPPAPPPAPPAGTLEVNPPEITYPFLEKSWPVVAKALKLPEAAVAAMPPCLAMLGVPVTFEGTGWKAGDMVSIELMLPAGVRLTGMKPEEDSVGIAFATADASGRFMATMDTTAKLNWLLGSGITGSLTPDLKNVKPLPNNTYTIRATGADARTVTTGKWKLEMNKPAQ